MNNDEEIEFLDAEVSNSNTSNNSNNGGMNFNGFGSSYEKKEDNVIKEDAQPNKGPFTDINPKAKYFTPHIEEQPKEEKPVDNIPKQGLSANRTINFSQSTTDNSEGNTNYTSDTYNKNIGLMSRHYTERNESVDFKKVAPKCIMYVIIFGIIAFFAGPRYIVPYTLKYIKEPLINIFPNIDSGSISALYLILTTIELGLLSFFMGAFIYSVYNFIRKGEKLETFKDDVLKIFGICIMGAFLIAIISKAVKIDLVTPIIKVLTINGLLYK